MAYNSPRDPRLETNEPLIVRDRTSYGGWLPMILAIALAALIMAIVFPRIHMGRTNDTTDARPSVSTVAPNPLPAAPTTAPRTTEPSP